LGDEHQESHGEEVEAEQYADCQSPVGAQLDLTTNVR
jgi:hypothetical protein